MAETMSFRHFETGLRLIIDKNTNIPKVETVNDSRIYFSKCSKRKAFATVRGFENQQVFVECIGCFNEAQTKVVALLIQAGVLKQRKRFHH